MENENKHTDSDVLKSEKIARLETKYEALQDSFHDIKENLEKTQVYYLKMIKELDNVANKLTTNVIRNTEAVERISSAIATFADMREEIIKHDISIKEIVAWKNSEMTNRKESIKGRFAVIAAVASALIAAAAAVITALI